jgi:hypothetical protein
MLAVCACVKVCQCRGASPSKKGPRGHHIHFLFTLLYSLFHSCNGADMQRATNDLVTKLQQAQTLVTQLKDQRQNSNSLTRLWRWRSTREDVQKAKQALDSICEAAGHYTHAVSAQCAPSRLTAID